MKTEGRKKEERRKTDGKEKEEEGRQREDKRKTE